MSRTYETRSRFSPGSCQSPVSEWVEALALADAQATELSLGLFGSPTVRVGQGLRQTPVVLVFLGENGLAL